jgi:predicted ATPase
MAYLIVWVWEEHKEQSRLIRKEPQRRMVVLVDELEAHLHPQWQRSILPALLNVKGDLEAYLQIQFLVTTHSPLVVASIEPRFDATRDKIFHLDLVRSSLFDGEVVLTEPDFISLGTVDSWLRSDIFELRHARSLEAEQAIEDAKKLQRDEEKVATEKVREVSERLVKYLAADDRFWPRWTFFAEKHGVEL